MTSLCETVVRRAIFLCGLSILLLGSELSAQSAQPIVQHLNARNGLVDDGFNAFVFEDSQGFIWISSMNGCYRFDGQSIDHFPLDQSGEYDNAVVSSFFEDAEGDIYFTSSDCLYRYSPSGNRFHKIPILGVDRQLQRGIHAFHIDAQRDILWLSNVEHTWRFDTKREEVVGARFAGGHMRFLHLGTRGDTTEFLGFSWLLAKGVDYWMVVGDSLQKREATDTVLQRAFISGGLSLDPVTTWLFSDLGLLEVNRALQVRKLYRVPDAVDPGINGGVMISDSVLLLATRKAGMRLFNVASKSFGCAIRSDPSNPQSIQSDHVGALSRTSNRWIWAMQVEQGLDYFDGSELLEHESIVLPKGQRYLDAISARDGSLIALNGEGQVVMQASDGTMLTVQLEGVDELVAGNLSVDSTGLIWAITDQGLFRQFAPKGHMRAIRERNEGVNQLYRILHTERRHYLFGMGGVWLINGSRFEDVTSLFVDVKFLNKPLIQLRKGWFALPVEGHRLDLFACYKDTFTLLQKIELNAEVHDVILDERGDSMLVAATSTGILYLRKALDGGWSVFRSEHPERVVQRILLDSDGTLWCWSDKMIGRRGASDKEWTFRSVPGPGVRHPYAHLLLDHGEFGLCGLTEQGVIPYSVLAKASLSNGPEVYVDEIWINKRPYLNKASYLVDSLHLGRRENTLEFRVRPQQAMTSGNYTTEYRMTGYQEQWTPFDPEDRLLFTALEAGSYSFQARVTDPRNQTGPIKQLSFTIEPPFHRTLPFYLLLLGVFTGIVYVTTSLVYRGRLLRERRLRLRQELIDKERDRIASELHDDIGTELSSIRFLSEDIVNEFNIPLAHRISELSQNAIEQMRDIIWALNSEEGELGHLEERCTEFIENFSEQHQLTCEIRLNTAGHLGVKLSGEVKRNMFLILRELLQNSLKHADADKVEVCLSATNTSLTLAISDNGCGYQIDSLPKNGYGLVNIRRRADQIGALLKTVSKPGEGTHTTIVVDL